MPVYSTALYCASILLVFVFAVALAASVPLGAGWWWDVAGAVGFVAFAFFGLLNLATGQGARLISHRRLGWWALGLTTLHAALYLFTDSVAIQHLKLAAPPAMLVGIAVLLVALVGAVISLPGWKLPVHGSRQNFRRYHRLMSWAVLLGCLYHISATAHSVHHVAQMLLLAGGVCLMLLIAEKAASRMQGGVSIVRLLMLSLVSIVCFVVLRNA